jgi:nucleotide-binding universal stress UspA family protein
MFGKILAATVSPLECDACVLTAGRIAQNNNAKLFILHVLESDSSIYRNDFRHNKISGEIVGGETYPKKVKEEIEKKCKEDLAPLDKFDIRISIGSPWREVIKCAREERVDLIILGAHARKGGQEEQGRDVETVGGTADGVIRHERCPVMIAGKPIAESSVAFKKVMVAIDFSPSCISAFRFAADLAQNRGSKLYLFHMTPTPPQPEYTQSQYKADINRIQQRLKEEFLREISDTIEAEIDTWGGAHPHIEILKHARRSDVDLIVMGSHTKIKGKPQESRWYVGSAVERVSARSECPVVVITDPKVLEKFRFD